MCINKLDEKTKKYNSTYHRAIKMRPTDVLPSMYNEYGAENNNKDSKFKLGDLVRILKQIKYFCERLYSKLVWGSLCDQESKKYCA